jgi:hypothetical protein
VAKAPVRENGEFVVLAMMLTHFDEVTGIVSEEVFADDVYRRVFRTMLKHGGYSKKVEDELDPDARELLSRVLVSDAATGANIRVEGINLLRAAVRRELQRRVVNTTTEVITRDRIIKQQVDRLSGRDVADSDVADLLMWLFDVCQAPEG